MKGLCGIKELRNYAKEVETGSLRVNNSDRKKGHCGQGGGHLP